MLELILSSVLMASAAQGSCTPAPGGDERCVLTLKDGTRLEGLRKIQVGGLYVAVLFNKADVNLELSGPSALMELPTSLVDTDMERVYITVDTDDSGTAATAAPTATAPTKGTPSSAPEQSGQDEATWRRRSQDLKRDIANIKAELKPLKEEIKARERDAQYASQYSTVGQNNRAEAARLKREVAPLETTLRQAEGRYREFKQEARRRRVPAGWVR